MMTCRVLLSAIATFGLVCDALVLGTNASASDFMLVAGTSSPEEVCLFENAGNIGLDACSSAVAAGDGREIWSLTSNGQLMNAVSKKCASAAATSLVPSECGGASTWKMLPNGQVQVGEKCLSQMGEGAGTENVAAHVAAAASSSANSAFHAAAAAVDTDDATFWASRPGDAGPVTLTIELGEARTINVMKIAWEFPAQTFAVSVSSDGTEWTEVFATAVNMVKTSRIPLGLTARKIRVDMRKPHPLDGAFAGQAVYGIKSIALLAPRLEAALVDCSIASQSKDARDKYFMVSVSDFDPASSAALRAELPALAAAKTSLSSALSEVAALPSCDSGVAMMSTSSVKSMLVHDSSSRTRARGEGVPDLVSSMNGVDEVDVKMLLAVARSTIVGARGALR